jgi:hypothetical protein
MISIARGCLGQERILLPGKPRQVLSHREREEVAFFFEGTDCGETQEVIQVALTDEHAYAIWFNPQGQFLSGGKGTSVRVCRFDESAYPETVDNFIRNEWKCNIPAVGNGAFL